MNRQELATLLAQTQPQHSQHSQHSRRQQRSHGPRQPLSPRQIFQSHVRTLSDEDPHLAGFNNQPRGELQHLSSLRVHVRSPPTPVAEDSFCSADKRFSYIAARPDFFVEEREAWNRQSPQRPAPSKQSRCNLRENDYILIPDDDQHSISSFPSHNTALKPFGPPSSLKSSDERPKTSRGLTSDSHHVPGAFPVSAVSGDPPLTRKSKFSEGSMNDRSVGVSSTWVEHGPPLTESLEEDSNGTPRASKFTRDDTSSSDDWSEFQPAATTPATMKQKLSRLTSGFKSGDEMNKSQGPHSNQGGRVVKRKGLRKNISTWNLHHIGERIGLFGTSSNDTAESTSGSKGKTPNPQDILNERKRKAEEVYAQQFGSKKQKSNAGLAVEHQQPTQTPSQHRTLRKRAVSAQPTVTPATARRRNNMHPSSKATISDSVAIWSETDTDHSKRATRRELEKENQTLRALLREHQAQSLANMQRCASKSSLHLPQDEAQASSNPWANTSPSDTTRSTLSSGTSAGLVNRKERKRYHNAGIPPVPALPSRAVLASLTNLNGGPMRSEREAICDTNPSTMKQARDGDRMPKSAEMGKDVYRSPTGRAASNEKWEWPEDVF